MRNYAPLEVSVITPRIALHAATDELLGKLEPLVRAGKAAATPAPYDDPMSLYEDDPDARVRSWLQGIWRGRGSVTADFWRLYFVVMIDGEPVGMQDMIGDRFRTFGSITSFSWLSSDERRRGIGREMREAILHLAFDGFEAAEASSEAFEDNRGSNGVSRALGYRENGVTWAARQGERALMQKWRLTREDWLPGRRQDITLVGVSECRVALGIA